LPGSEPVYTFPPQLPFYDIVRRVDMAIGLQAGIDLANSRNCDVSAVISMHDASGVVFFGLATPTVCPDVPLLNTGATIGGPRWFRRLQVPGFFTPGTHPPDPTFRSSYVPWAPAC